MVFRLAMLAIQCSGQRCNSAIIGHWGWHSIIGRLYRAIGPSRRCGLDGSESKKLRFGLTLVMWSSMIRGMYRAMEESRRGELDGSKSQKVALGSDTSHEVRASPVFCHVDSAEAGTISSHLVEVAEVRWVGWGHLIWMFRRWLLIQRDQRN